MLECVQSNNYHDGNSMCVYTDAAVNTDLHRPYGTKTISAASLVVEEELLGKGVGKTLMKVAVGFLIKTSFVPIYALLLKHLKN